MHYLQTTIYTCFLSLCLLTTPALALEVNISKSLSGLNTAHNGNIVRIERNQDQKNVLTGGYTKTSRQCPPFCIQPINVAPGVTTIAELEVITFIKNSVNKGTGVLIDARTKSWFDKSTIPSSMNIPFKTFDKTSSDLVKASALAKLGVTVKSDQTDNSDSLIDKMMNIMKEDTLKTSSKWDFSLAKKVVIWCNGVWCGQSPRAIKGMLVLGYPADKIYYYRGGMQAWQSLGLTIVKGNE